MFKNKYSNLNTKPLRKQYLSNVSLTFKIICKIIYTNIF